MLLTASGCRRTTSTPRPSDQEQSAAPAAESTAASTEAVTEDSASTATTDEASAAADAVTDADADAAETTAAPAEDATPDTEASATATEEDATASGTPPTHLPPLMPTRQRRRGRLPARRLGRHRLRRVCCARYRHHPATTPPPRKGGRQGHRLHRRQPGHRFRPGGPAEGRQGGISGQPSHGVEHAAIGVQLQAGSGHKLGQAYRISVPEGLRFPEGTTWDLKDKDGNVVAVMSFRNGELYMGLTDYVETHEEVCTFLGGLRECHRRPNPQYHRAMDLHYQRQDVFDAVGSR